MSERVRKGHGRRTDSIPAISTCYVDTGVSVPGEHAMMERLIIDDLLHWARTYRVRPLQTYLTVSRPAQGTP